MYRKCIGLFIVLWFTGIATAQSAQATTRFVVSLPEVLMLRINGEASGQVPVQVSGGEAVPRSLHIEVLAIGEWRLTVRATPLVGPIELPPERLRLAGRPLAEYEQVVSLGRGPAVLDLPLTVDLQANDPPGVYKAMLTFEIYRP